MNDRPSIDQTMMDIAKTWSFRSRCLRRQVGSVIVKDKHVLTSGYNGPPKGLPHCDECGGCLRQEMDLPSGERQELCRGSHAELNAIIQAAIFGISVKGATLYCTNFPCNFCAKAIVQAEIKKVIYEDDYTEDDNMAKQMLEHVGIKMEKFE